MTVLQTRSLYSFKTTASNAALSRSQWGLAIASYVSKCVYSHSQTMGSRARVVSEPGNEETLDCMLASVEVVPVL